LHEDYDERSIYHTGPLNANLSAPADTSPL